ncbi:branched-chain amino acid transport system II carrier protein [Bacillus sp. FSL H8-0547]
MSNKSLTIKETFVIGLMLFALFFGAGNLIFPPALGQLSGDHMWTAIIGFLITGVGLPLLGVIAIGLSGSDIQSLAGRVHPLFGFFFPFVLYLAIGPIFAIPRTATVTYEIGVIPYLPESLSGNGWILFLFTLVFFAVTYWLSLNPTKLVDTIGKLLTPVLLLVLALIAVKMLISPLGTFESPTKEYENGAFFKGFLEGYLTMDTLAALVFGIVVINAVKDKGVTDRSQIAKICLNSGLIAAAGLMLVYISLAYLGATSVSKVGYLDNGGAILSESVHYLFGSFGNAVLGTAILFACLTTSIGLVSSCGNYFSKIFPSLSYKTITLIICLFSMTVANAGLTKLISFSVPVLVALYPLAIVLIALSFFHSYFRGANEVYLGSLLFTFVISVADGLKAGGLLPAGLDAWMKGNVPLFEYGIGFIVPAAVGGVLGYVYSSFRTAPASPDSRRK